MNPTNNTIDQTDPFKLSRFTAAQESSYQTALIELNNGQKISHWMWYIFPQIDGLGFSPTTKFYAIKSLAEARAYLEHPVLGKRLLECAETVLKLERRSISAVFGYPDDLKFKSSMTLFAVVAEDSSVFARNLDKYFRGEHDSRTLELLERSK